MPFSVLNSLSDFGACAVASGFFSQLQPVRAAVAAKRIAEVATCRCRLVMKCSYRNGICVCPGRIATERAIGGNWTLVLHDCSPSRLCRGDAASSCRLRFHHDDFVIKDGRDLEFRKARID